MANFGEFFGYFLYFFFKKQGFYDLIILFENIFLKMVKIHHKNFTLNNLK